MKVDGTCHCGAVSFEAEVTPGQINICHCADCQRLTGSAFRAAISAGAASFRLLRGSPRIYIKTADSGTQRAHAFCSDCGTPIYSAALHNPPSYSLRVGTLTQRYELGTPLRQIWTQRRLPWVCNLDSLTSSRA